MHLLAVAALTCVLTLTATACARGSGSTGPAATAPCGPVETPPEQVGGHLIGDATPPVPYNSVPPTSGWHVSGPVEIGVHGPDDPLSEPEQVTALELGAVVVAYHEIGAENVAALEALAREYAGRIAVTPYDALDSGQVAMTTYGALQVCDRLHVPAVRAFADAYTVPPVSDPRG